ncbi:MAG: pyruvate ferredoxin oxidoreductase [Candidatus Omnitrophica bacterium CG12_big_fil_rev_8_21_14_0_65_43_15]|uniref:Pyruvate ferredoxin oxidoreductase n=1 Tax=Candidatus Taenaricola geysiri TaxID=1974752 RepID=A0A2J0LJX2_9BACT|nr:MAG: pyruvate ferredoxin oxidoreductase [Candidatus Omnitrophica bacterium CG1_02_43_210]PIR66146.1 MAG: pyruvate ferredoxin oxidoreductase [Candidatus Omnitrophica bacterium CG10_big_fil_rev_8_21_14_0_10_43_8]PIV12472.1 MAG: pyruvate ferredoxin oxidoreductase [Candidatus Omnitrophica bacterium CG03_land_8_20_14_0_80_43_22]PIW66340.1 MAG: pyruvate ferredoxin oxidoreductase [Candidatus Omnitrophica bacterium CG12_big_fil_rev_8_21_14_0_65_43_15]PIY84058.1 MAG: pyruvate ferredoxin oxidoreductas
MKLVITGNHAAAYAAKLCRPHVISAYPITPQTEVVEKLACMVADGELKSDFIKVESEHSAMAACIGASAAGSRSFTATSSQGLALMHEMLFWAANSRLPIVMINVNRAMAPPWTVWADQTDSLAQRDTGWMQFYCEDNQEILDTVIQAYKIAEKVSLPAMISLDAFFLSHTSEAVDVPPQADVDRFLPEFNPEYKLDINNPRAFGGLVTAEWYYEFRYKIHQAMQDAKREINTVGKEYAKSFGRKYSLIEPYKADDADFLFAASGSMVSVVRDAVDKLRKAQKKAGLIKMRTFRPFPKEELIKLVPGAKNLCVLDRNISLGNEGIFFTEIKAALANIKAKPMIYGFTAGLGGREVSVNDVMNIAKSIETHKAAEFNFYGLKK